MSPLLEIRDLLVHREKMPVLEIEYLAIEPGEVLAVVGPNGAGKSTLLLTLARLLRAERGQILFNGEQAAAESDLDYRRRIALVLQEPLLLDLSVRENVAVGLKFRGTPAIEIEKRTAEWLGRLGVAHLANRPAKKLSVGEAQRVSLARAFVLQPELLLLDEPFTALDAPTRARLLDDLKSLLAETGTTTIFITHDLQEALKLAARMAVILNGKLEQWGSPQEVFARPVNEAMAKFLGVQPNSSGNL